MDYTIGLSIDKDSDEPEVHVKIEIGEDDSEFTIPEAERLRDVLDQMIAAAKSLLRLKY